MIDKKIILCDADDVIENFCDTWIGYLNNKYGTKVLIEDIVDWDIRKAFPELTSDQIFAPTYEKTFWNRIEAMPGCYEVLKMINTLHNLYIVTASNYQTCDAKIEKILELYSFLNWDQFVITSKKQLVFGDYLIDDGVHNLEDGRYKGILFDRPHNRLFDEKAAGITRVYSWDEIGQILL